MPVSAEITCVNKSNRQIIHNRMKRIGGINSHGTRWKVLEAIAGIGSNKWSFWAQTGSQRMDVYVARHNEKMSLKTHGDIATRDNQLNPPECPKS